ncbi:hypothetical protein M8C21_018554, partial [Ambrosia artemisiifolia]
GGRMTGTGHLLRQLSVTGNDHPNITLVLYTNRKPFCDHHRTPVTIINQPQPPLFDYPSFRSSPTTNHPYRIPDNLQPSFVHFSGHPSPPVTGGGCLIIILIFEHEADVQIESSCPPTTHHSGDKVIQTMITFNSGLGDKVMVNGRNELAVKVNGVAVSELEFMASGVNGGGGWRLKMKWWWMEVEDEVVIANKKCMGKDSNGNEVAKTRTAKQHVAEIRKTKFSIGGQPNPLTEDLHQAVKNLSAELYAKDVHFLMELIQNAEDNAYPDGVDPSLEFVITSNDITNTGAPATLLVFNNEKGFSPKNVESICSVGRSTKKGLRKRGYIGEKGIGFKSVFLITSQPYIFSNGYKIRFNEKPCQHCNVGYIVPEWVEEGPTLSDIQSVYGLSTALPTTTLVLPLKAEKVKPVKDQLSSIHPEVLLFLSKIKRLSVREDNKDPKLNTVSAISISSEKNFVTIKSMDAESYTLHLSADVSGNQEDTECGYYMWKQRFPVKQANKVEVRSEVEEWVITLAFPNGKRLNRGASMPGIYSFLPTETSSETAPVSSLPNQFRFLPIMESSHSKLNRVRDVIKSKLMNETIVPCESYTGQKLFRRPSEVGRLKPAFWSIMNKARSQGVNFSNVSSHGVYLLTFSFDQVEYNSILKFLEIEAVDNEWYAKCIAGSNLCRGVSEELYMQLLAFVAENWGSAFHNTNMKNIPFIKYVGMDGKSFTLLTVNVKFVSVSEYADDLIPSLKTDRKLAVTYAHFLYHSKTKTYLLEHQVQNLCSKMPIVDIYGQVTVKRDGVLVPANGSKWVVLIGSNPWRQFNYVELGEDYTRSMTYFGNSASGVDLVSFMKTYVGAADVPFLSPPNAAVPTLSSPLTKTNAFLLLRWLNYLRKKNANLPERFLSSIKNGSWLKISLSGFPGSRPPSESFMLDTTSGSILQNGSVLVDIPLVDVKFYGDEIMNYKEELKTVGVRYLGVVIDVKEGCQVIASYLDSQSNFERINRFYNYLSEFKWEPTDDDCKKIWLPSGTDNGEWVSPQDCVLHDKNNLFGGLLYVLEKYKYETKIFGFFAEIFNVKVHPSVDDYCNLWKKWEATGNKITHTECCAFWEFVIKNWNPVTEKTFNNSLSKLPVSSLTSDGICLSDKRDVFIGDDLFLTDLFQSCSGPIFVWYPQPSSKTVTRTKLVDIYNKLGVRTISASAKKNLSDIDQMKLESVSSKEKIMKKGLVKLILGFLADPSLKLDTEKRHEAISRMLGLKAFVTVDPMTVKYSLSLSSGDVVTVEAKRMIRWDKENSKLFMQKREVSGGQKSIIEYASHFGEVIAEGMLWETEEFVPQLSELIRLGYLVKFDEEAIDFLMKVKNLQERA